MKMKKWTSWGSKISAGVAAFLLLGITLFAVLYFGVIRTGFFEETLDFNRIAERLEMSEDDVAEVAEYIVDYTKGHTQETNITVYVKGTETEFLNEREQQHMADIAHKVKSLKLMAVAAGVYIAVVFTLLLRRKRGRLIAQSFVAAEGVVVGGLLVLGGFLAVRTVDTVNFLHRLFFENSLWILNPAKDRLIWFFPSELFVEAAVIVGVMMGSLVLAYTIAAVIILCRTKTQ